MHSIQSITKQHNLSTFINPTTQINQETNLSRESLDGLVQLTSNLLGRLGELLGLLARDLG